jgi:hypothetical protein
VSDDNIQKGECKGTKVQHVVILSVTSFAPGYQDNDQVKSEFHFDVLSRYVVL